MNSGYVFNYDREVEQFYQDHPEQRERVLFVETDGKSWRALGPDADWREGCIRNNHVMRERVLNFMFSDITACCSPVGENVSIVQLRTDQRSYRAKFNTVAAYDAKTAEVRRAYIFDHEVGHAIIRGAARGDNQSERKADAYAVLRHLQRFGGPDAYLQMSMDRLCAILFTDQIDAGKHFTQHMVEVMLKDAEATDFKTLTPRETVERADQYAVKHTLPYDFMVAVKKSYLVDTGNPDKDLKDCAARILTCGNDDVMKWGLRMLRCFLADTFRMKSQTGPLTGDHGLDFLRGPVDSRGPKLR